MIVYFCTRLHFILHSQSRRPVAHSHTPSYLSVSLFLLQTCFCFGVSLKNSLLIHTPLHRVSCRLPMKFAFSCYVHACGGAPFTGISCKTALVFRRSGIGDNTTSIFIHMEHCLGHVLVTKLWLCLNYRLPAQNMSRVHGHPQK